MVINQLKAGAVLNYVVLGLNSLIGLLYTPYMLRMMGQSEYGLYSLVASVIAYLTIMDFGFGNAIIRYTAKFRAEGKDREQSEMFGMFLILYSIIGILAFIAGFWLYIKAESLFGDTMTIIEISKARIMLLILAFNMAITFPFSIYGAIITAYEDFLFQKIVQILRIILNTVVMICLLHMGYKAIAMVVVQTIFNITTLLLNLLYCKYRIRIKFIFGHFDWRFLKEVSIYSFWIFLNAIIDRIYFSTGQFILGAVVGTAAVAVFAVVIQLENMYMSFSTAISGVFLPKVSSMVAKHCSNQEISDIFIRIGRIQYIVLAYILTCFIIFGEQFIVLWAGENYREVYNMTLLLFIPSTITLSQNLGITILQAKNQMRFRSLTYIVIAAISMFAQVLFAKSFGAIGCTIAIAGALCLGHILIMNIYYQRVQHIDMLRFWIEIMKMSVTPLLLLIGIKFCFGSMNGLNSIMKLGTAILAFSAVYIPLFYLFSTNKYERDLITKPILSIIKR